MAKTITYTLVIVIIFLFSCCAPSRFVKPLVHQQHAASFSFGGPLIHYGGAAIPIPFSTLGYAYGFHSSSTAHAHLHTTSLLFGNLQGDIGTSVLLTDRDKKFGCSVSPALQMAVRPGEKNSARIWPSADVNAFINLGNKGSFLYAGLNTWIETANQRAHGEPQTRNLLPNLHIGFQKVNRKFDHQFELKYLGLGIPNLPGVVSYIGLNQRGSFGLYYSLIKKF